MVDGVGQGGHEVFVVGDCDDAVAVVAEGKVVYAKGFGQRNVAQSLPMTADTLLPIGSVTKSFTTLTLGMLVDEGKLEWDKPLRTYLPEFRAADDILTVSLVKGDGLLQWRPLSKDAVSVPDSTPVPASMKVAVGETYDFEFEAPSGRGSFWIEVRGTNGRWQAQGQVLVKP